MELQEYINKECEKLIPKINALVAYSINGDCGSITVWDCEKDLKEALRTSLTNLAKYQVEEIEKRIEELEEPKMPIQTGLFSDCPKCGQEVNIKFVGDVLLEVRNQALSEVRRIIFEKSTYLFTIGSLNAFQLGYSSKNKDSEMFRNRPITLGFDSRR